MIRIGNVQAYLCGYILECFNTERIRRNISSAEDDRCMVEMPYVQVNYSSIISGRYPVIRNNDHDIVCSPEICCRDCIKTKACPGCNLRMAAYRGNAGNGQMVAFIIEYMQANIYRNIFKGSISQMAGRRSHSI